jgi:hypothetical protein
VAGACAQKHNEQKKALERLSMRSKKLGSIVVIFGLGLSVFCSTATATSTDSKSAGSTTLGRENRFDAKRATKGTDITYLSNMICDMMSIYASLGKPMHHALIGLIRRELGLDSDDPNLNDSVTLFWNENFDDLICTGFHKDHEYPQHMLKRVISLRVFHTFFAEFFFKNRNLTVNNQQIRDGSNETILDFIDRVLADPRSEKTYNVYMLREVRKMLLFTYDAKTAAQLMEMRGDAMEN